MRGIVVVFPVGLAADAEIQQLQHNQTDQQPPRYAKRILHKPVANVFKGVGDFC